MKIQASIALLPSAIAALLYFLLAASTYSSIPYAEAFVPLSSSSSSITKSIMTTTPPTQLRAEIGDSGVAFEHVAREWRCKVCHIIYLIVTMIL